MPFRFLQVTARSALIALFLSLPAAAWGCSMLLCGVGSAGGAAPPSFSLSYDGGSNYSTDTSNTTIDYGTLTYNSSNQRVIVQVQYIANSGGVVTGVTVGGTSLSQVSGAATTSGAGFVGVDTWESSAPLSGSSGDVKVTYNQANQWHSAVALYSLNAGSPIPSTAVTAATSGVAQATSRSTTLSIPSSGAALVSAVTYNGGKSITFTNASIDVVVSGGGDDFTFGHSTVTGSQTIGASWSSADYAAMSSIPWGT